MKDQQPPSSRQFFLISHPRAQWGPGDSLRGEGSEKIFIPPLSLKFEKLLGLIKLISITNQLIEWAFYFCVKFLEFEPKYQ